MPSIPKPRTIVSSVVIDAPTGKSSAVVRVQSFAFAALPAAAPGTVQPPRSPPSNDVVVPSGSVMSSRKTPTCWAAQSLA
jgi:hypothetical protein